MLGVNLIRLQDPDDNDLKNKNKKKNKRSDFIQKPQQLIKVANFFTFILYIHLPLSEFKSLPLVVHLNINLLLKNLIEPQLFYKSFV